MEIHVVNAANGHLYIDELEAFFRARHAIYVEEKGWREDDGTGLEIDRFDTEFATYLIGIAGGEIVAGTRLLPTTEPHMLSEVFPHLCNFGQPIRSPEVAEWTRGFITRKHREQGHGPLKGQFCGTVMEYCLLEGISLIGGIQDVYWLRLWRRFGWAVLPISTVTYVDGRRCLAAYLNVTPDARDCALAQGGINGSILVHRGPYQPFHPRIGRLVC